MSFERRLNGLEHKLSPQGSGDSLLEVWRPACA